MSNDKSPLHPSALRIRDLHPGRRVIRYNLANGISGHATIVSAPRAVYEEYFGKRCLKLNLRSDSGDRYEYFLSDLGVIPYSSNNWNTTNFVIDARKEHLLPKAVASFRPWRDETIEDDTFDLFEDIPYY